MMVVERQKTNSLQAEVLRFGADNLQLSQHWDRSKEEAARLQARCNNVWHPREPTQ